MEKIKKNSILLVPLLIISLAFISIDIVYVFSHSEGNQVKTITEMKPQSEVPVLVDKNTQESFLILKKHNLMYKIEYNDFKTNVPKLIGKTKEDASKLLYDKGLDIFLSQ